VPTSCFSSNGYPFLSFVADTRTHPDENSCIDHWNSWMTSSNQFYTSTVSDRTYTTTSEGAETRSTAYIAPSACMSFCTISASRVQVLYWPTPYPIPGSNATLTSAAERKMAVGPDGYTIISPTAYVIFSGLSAKGEFATLTRTYENITRAYAPDQLSTFYSCDLPRYHTSRINFQDFKCSSSMGRHIYSSEL